MSIRTGSPALASPMTYVPYGAENTVSYANHRAGLRPLQHIWDAMMALLAHPIPSTTKDNLWHEETDKYLLAGLDIARQLHNAHHYSSLSDVRLFHPFFIALHDTRIIASSQTFSLSLIDSMQRKSKVRWQRRAEIIEHLSIIRLALMNKYNEAYNYERSIREKKNTITRWKNHLAKAHTSIYVLRLILQTPKPTAFEDIIASQKRICDALSRRQKICKDKLGYFWAISCESETHNRPAYHMMLTLMFPVASIINRERYQQEIKDIWCSGADDDASFFCLGYPSNLHKGQRVQNGTLQAGDIINFTDPQHVEAINRMLEEYYLEQRLVRMKRPTKTAGISLLKE